MQTSYRTFLCSKRNLALLAVTPTSLQYPPTNVLSVSVDFPWAEVEMMLSCGCAWWYSEVQCDSEQYCTGTWNIRSMNQGKLDVVKQEMARVNTDILGISELK